MCLRSLCSALWRDLLSDFCIQSIPTGGGRKLVYENVIVISIVDEKVIVIVIVISIIDEKVTVIVIVIVIVVVRIRIQSPGGEMTSGHKSRSWDRRNKRKLKKRPPKQKVRKKGRKLR